LQIGGVLVVEDVKKKAREVLDTLVERDEARAEVERLRERVRTLEDGLGLLARAAVDLGAALKANERARIVYRGLMDPVFTWASEETLGPEETPGPAVLTLREKRVLFTGLVARLIDKAFRLGFEAAGNEWLRSAAVAKANAEAGVGIADSLHIDGLALDLILYKDGEWLKKTESYLGLGEWWEQQHELCRWGGRFGDGNHFSLAHRGRR